MTVEQLGCREADDEPSLNAPFFCADENSLRRRVQSAGFANKTLSAAHEIVNGCDAAAWAAATARRKPAAGVNSANCHRAGSMSPVAAIRMRRGSSAPSILKESSRTHEDTSRPHAFALPPLH